MAHILDVSHLLPGSLIATEMLRAGHRVTRVEAPERRRKPSILGPAIDRALRQGKSVRIVDLKTTDGQRALHALLKKADALIHGFYPTTARRLGLDPSTLHRVNPRLIVVQLHGSAPLHDLNAQALAGMLPPEGGMPALPFAQWAVVLRGSVSLLAALSARALKRRSQGPILHVSLEKESQAWAHWTAPLLQGKYPCYSLYVGRARQSWAVAAVEELHWRTFCEHLGLPFTSQDRFAVGSRGQAVRRAISRRLRLITFSGFNSKLRKKPCCVTPVRPLKR